MKKTTILGIALAFVSVLANANSTQNEHNSKLMETLEPTYLNGAIYGGHWGRNWFFDITGGASAFLGSPIGCGDVFDRIKPTLQVGIGKWFTPAIGTRIGYQGMNFIDGNLMNQGYHNVHADLLFNATHMVGVNEVGLSRWDIVPYLGAGIILHEENRNRPFSLHYGVMVRFRVTNSFHLVGELGGLSTFEDFDGLSSPDAIGDNMLNLTFGFNVTLGKAGWKKVVDARPYMEQNELLIGYAEMLKEENDRLAKLLQKNELILNEYEKILRIEGLLKKYHKTLSLKKGSEYVLPRNNYSGLNSLRARLANKGTEAKDSVAADTIFTNEKMNMNAYMASVKEGNEYIGAPIYFFFQLATTKMTDPSQKLNLDEIASIIKRYGLLVSVEGAADSATGTKEINDRLSLGRADFIIEELKKRGVTEADIKKKAKGGVEEHDSNEANRHTKVTLYVK